MKGMEFSLQKLSCQQNFLFNGGMGMYKSILWVEDFDIKNSGDGPDRRGKQSIVDRTRVVDEYFKSENVCLVDVKEKMIDALEAIDNNFQNYDVIVLDINLETGILLGEEECIIERLKKYGVCVAQKKTENGIEEQDLKKNAGYYLYLYLLKKGFPYNRICMLSANVGKGNLTDTWESTFRSSGLVIPLYFDRNTKKSQYGEEFEYWLDKNSPPYYQLRRCVISMCSIIAKYLRDKLCPPTFTILNSRSGKKGENENILDSNYFINLLEDLMDIPQIGIDNLSKSVEEKPTIEEKKVYYRLLSKLSHDWEGKPINGSNESTMRLLRNWIAHSRLLNDTLQCDYVAFLFGIGMRALFEVDKMEYGLRNYYCEIEKRLIGIIFKCNKNDNFNIKDYIEKSNKDFLMKLLDIRKIPTDFKDTVGLIQFLGGDKNNSPIQCKYSYILRYFGHYMLKTNLSQFDCNYDNDNGKVCFAISFCQPNMELLEGNIIGETYLKASLALWK